jgi:hypothetical protein
MGKEGVSKKIINKGSLTIIPDNIGEVPFTASVWASGNHPERKNNPPFVNNPVRIKLKAKVLIPFERL